MFQASMDLDSKQVVKVQDLRCPENHRFVIECPKFANLEHCHLTFFSADEEGEGRSERTSRLPAPAFKMPQPFRAHAQQPAERSGREEPKRSRSLVLRPHHQPDSTPSNSETHQRRKTITKIPGPKKNLRLKNSLFIYASYSSLCKRVLKSLNISSCANGCSFCHFLVPVCSVVDPDLLYLRKENHKATKN
jgi:hypothetical protein